MDRQHADLRSPRRLVRAGAFALVGVVAMLTSAVPASAHAGNGDTTAGHVCIDAEGGYHLASEESSASCPTGQTAAHLASTPITGPQTTIPGDDEDGDSSTGSVGPAGPIGPRGPDGPTGPTGPSGAQGEPGLNGVDGLNGFDGADGAAGAAGPAGSQGEAGPQGAAGALGPAGANGADGADGEDGELGPSGPTGPQGPSGPAGSTGPQGTAGTAGASGSAGTTGAIGASGATGANGATGATGATGPSGRTIFSGGDDPDSGDGDDGDYYINTDTNTIFGPKGAEDPGEWPDGVSLVGAAGSQFYSGTATPGPSDYENGDFYFETDDEILYCPKTAGVWGSGTDVTGAPGSQFYSGTATPTTEGVVGDFYFDTDDEILYGPKTGGGWGSGADVTGAPGSQFYSGTATPTTEGVVGDFYFDTDDEILYGPKTGGGWGSGTDVTGDPGTPGTPGAAGSTIHSGSGAPDDGTGQIGDYFFRTDTHALIGPKLVGGGAPGTWAGATSTSLQPAISVAFGGYVILTNVSNGGADTYDSSTNNTSLGLGTALVDFTGRTSLRFDVNMQYVASTGTVSFQLFNVTDGTELAVVSVGAGGVQTLTTTAPVAVTGVKLIRVRAKSTVAADDPRYFSSALYLT